MIKVKVILKSLLKSKLGITEDEIILEDNSTPKDLSYKLAEKYGNEVKQYLIHEKSNTIIALFSCNKTRCTTDHILKDGDVVSIFPPISGG